MEQTQKENMRGDACNNASRKSMQWLDEPYYLREIYINIYIFNLDKLNFNLTLKTMVTMPFKAHPSFIRSFTKFLKCYQGKTFEID